MLYVFICRNKTPIGFIKRIGDDKLIDLFDIKRQTYKHNDFNNYITAGCNYELLYIKHTVYFTILRK